MPMVFKPNVKVLVYASYLEALLCLNQGIFNLDMKSVMSFRQANCHFVYKWPRPLPYLLWRAYLHFINQKSHLNRSGATSMMFQDQRNVAFRIA
jgi:hypothetical protein